MDSTPPKSPRVPPSSAGGSSNAESSAPAQSAEASPPAASTGSESGSQPSSAGARPAAPPGSLRRKATRGALWVVGGYGVTQVVRLCSSLILSRLLFPEAFGLMRIVNMVNVGVGMLSDAGLRGSIIYHPRGDDRDFLDTAWTLQCLRGVAVAVVLFAIAVPVADFYGAPELKLLLPAVGASTLVLGMQSTSVHTLSRRVNPAPAAILEASLRATSLVLMVSIALVWKSVWVLMIGSVFVSVGRVLVSHRLIKGYRNRFRWERDAVRSMLRYGRWVFLSSALAAVLSQGDSALLAKVLTDERLGVYSFARLLASAATEGMASVSTSVLQPLYAQFARENSRSLKRRMFKVRGALLSAALPVLWGMSILGQEIVDLLFDDRYVQAGWMLRILAAGAEGTVVVTTAEKLLVATGDSLAHLIHKVVGAVLFLVGMVVGYLLGDLVGLLIGMSVGRVLGYVPMAILLQRRGGWLPGLDLVAFGVSAAVLALGFLLYPPVIGS